MQDTVNNTYKLGDDVKQFMIASGQTVGQYNKSQFDLYINLIEEEYKELHSAINDTNLIEQLDALIDIMVVVTGAIHSMGADIQGAWNEVMKTNLAKIDITTGVVLKRPDGKIQKPPGWQPPKLDSYLSTM